MSSLNFLHNLGFKPDCLKDLDELFTPSDNEFEKALKSGADAAWWTTSTMQMFIRKATKMKSMKDGLKKPLKNPMVKEKVETKGKGKGKRGTPSGTSDPSVSHFNEVSCMFKTGHTRSTRHAKRRRR